MNNITKKFGTEYALQDVSLEIGSGLSFIIGASGSGKTTLLRILSGLEPVFEGSVSYCGKDLKAMTAQEKSSLYNDVFGFVWQDFNLLDDRTVLENVLLPRYLKKDLKEKEVMSILQELKIADLAEQKVGKLSGGQKQRVAIARELMKEPQVILADEPTSALDVEASKEIMGILRRLSRRRAVIIVTHDTSLIREGDKVYELDKGELINRPEKDIVKVKGAPTAEKPKLSLGRAFTLARSAFRCQPGRTAASLLSFLVAAVLLLVPLSGALNDSSQAVFDELFATYGDGLLDISLYDNFFSASGTEGDIDGPKADVKQNIDGLFERYRDDERVQHVLFAQAFGNIKIQADGKEYAIETTNNMPVFNHLVEGKMPMADGMEIAVPESFVKKMGLTNEEAIGKEIRFSGTVFNWESGQPVETPMSCTVTIVGVADTTMVTEYNGQTYEYPMGDSFFFSPAALAVMRESASMKSQPGSFYIRCKTPADLIAVKDELNAEGIVPLGRFELVEDIVRLNEQTKQQTGTAMWVISGLALLVVPAVAIITAVLRRREFAIEKVSGYAAAHLAGMTGAEALLQGVGAAVLFILTSPLLNLGTTALWQVSILTPSQLFGGAVLCIILSVLSFAVTVAVAAGTKAHHCLRTGDR